LPWSTISDLPPAFRGFTPKQKEWARRRLNAILRENPDIDEGVLIATVLKQLKKEFELKAGGDYRMVGDFKFGASVRALDGESPHEYPIVATAASDSIDRQNDRFTEKALASMAEQAPIVLAVADSHEAALINPLSEAGEFTDVVVKDGELCMKGYIYPEWPFAAWVYNRLGTHDGALKVSVAGRVPPGAKRIVHDPLGKGTIREIDALKLDHVLLTRPDAAVNQDTGIVAAKGTDDWADAVFKAAAELDDVGGEQDDEVEKAARDTAYFNDLPDSYFLFVEPGGKKDAEGKTVPRTLRHLPFKDKNGNLDEARIRNAISRASQIKLKDGTRISEAKARQLQERARKLLEQVKKAVTTEEAIVQEDVQEGSEDMAALETLAEAVKGLTGLLTAKADAGQDVADENLGSTGEEAEPDEWSDAEGGDGSDTPSENEEEVEVEKSTSPVEERLDKLTDIVAGLTSAVSAFIAEKADASSSDQEEDTAKAEAAGSTEGDAKSAGDDGDGDGREESTDDESDADVVKTVLGLVSDMERVVKAVQELQELTEEIQKTQKVQTEKFDLLEKASPFSLQISDNDTREANSVAAAESEHPIHDQVMSLLGAMGA